MVKAFQVENPTSLTDAIRALEDVATESVLRRATVAGARVILQEAKLRVPVGGHSWERDGHKHYPGFLRDNLLIAYDHENSVKARLATYLVTWSRDAYYGRFLEHGTSQAAARPFLRPAYDATLSSAAATVKRTIEDQIREVTGG
ncbi:hypothetical protein G3N95_34945 [Paraburkholderia sp. Tr-20389]|uniref:HK97-gp10 family putative phage morphogenesis protein n=1 Tax=Paraburkholderia sp. Tr-20389 TaxID=2703903 RepID=UPI00197EF518|nr:HK97-gp10 family putative phage morphogenesis protein [Paraburkholderia sp. Tr-20389]MBN3758158.1 hypothetical protein [Paraburkholderia sp. Tr-20389]